MTIVMSCCLAKTSVFGPSAATGIVLDFQPKDQTTVMTVRSYAGLGGEVRPGGGNLDQKCWVCIPLKL